MNQDTHLLSIYQTSLLNLEVSLNLSPSFSSTDHEPSMNSTAQTLTSKPSQTIYTPISHLNSGAIVRSKGFVRLAILIFLFGVLVILCRAGVFDCGEDFVVDALLHALFEVDGDNDNSKDRHDANDGQKTG